MTASALDRGRLSRTHQRGGDLAEVLREVSGYARLRDEYDKLSALAPPAQLGSAEDAVTAALAVELSTAAPDVGRVTEVARRHAADAAAADLVRTAIGQRRAAVANELDGLVATHEAEVYAALHDRLELVLEEAAETLATLRGVSTAEDALANRDRPGVLDAWERWPALESRYAGLRSAQQHLWATTETRGRNLRTIVAAFIAAPDVCDPDYVARRTGRRIATPDGTRTPRPAPWPDLWAGDALRWCATNPDARPWVPTPHQLEEAEERIAAVCRAFADTAAEEARR